MIHLGDNVRLIKGDKYTVAYHGRKQRKVAEGTLGFVERMTGSGAVLRVVVNDAPDGLSDIIIVASSRVTKV